MIRVLRQDLSLDAIKVAAVLTTPDFHSEQELNAARTRFCELYVAELRLGQKDGVK